MRSALGLIFALACVALGTGCARSQPARASANVSSSASSPASAPPLANAATRAPCAHRTAHGSRIPGAAWQTLLEERTGNLSLTADDRILVAWQQAGKSVSIDLESGAICAVVGQASGDAPGSAIDPNTEQVGVSHGALVGPRRFGIAAVELGNGAVRWTRTPLAKGNTDEYLLPSELEVTSTVTATIVQFAARYRDGDSFHLEQLIAALDPRTGADLWRKIVVKYPRGESMPRDAIRISTDDERVFVRSDGKLQALDESGKEMWSTTWPALGIVIGPPSVATRGPLVAAGTGRVALAFPGRIELFDARTGAKSGVVAISGEVPTDLALRDGRVIAALESQPGTARLLVFDALSARTVWTAPVRYSVKQLRVDADFAYALDGNGRIWARALESGALRFGLDASGAEFAVARTSGGTLRVVVPKGGVTAFDPAPGDTPAPLQPFALWELEAKPGPDADACYPRSLSWLDGDDRVLWRRELPARLRQVQFGDCAEIEASEYRRSPRYNAHLLYAVFGSLALDEILVEADLSGLLALRKTDGKLLLDFAAPMGGALYFDEGQFELVGVPDCKGRSSGAKVFARCGDRLVYFNGSTVVLLKLNPLRVEARRAFHAEMAQWLGQGGKMRAAIPVGRTTLRLEGSVFMR